MAGPPRPEIFSRHHRAAPTRERSERSGGARPGNPRLCDWKEGVDGSRSRLLPTSTSKEMQAGSNRLADKPGHDK
jgi:hypothetical protein